MTVRNILRRLLPRRFSRHRILSGPLAGKRIVTSWHDYPAAILGYAEVALTKWLRTVPQDGETWLDVGAHYGYTSLALCEAVGPRGRVFAFEPSLSTVGCLSRTREENTLSHLRLVPFALSDDHTLRSERMASGRGMIDAQLTNDDASQREQFLSCSFDSIWPGICENDDVVQGVKIDVQGMELAVLRGMQKMFRKHRPIIVLEVHRNVSRQAILNILAECGYDLTPTPIEKEHTDFFDETTNFSFVFKRRE